MKVLSKGSKKWIADHGQTHPLGDIYPTNAIDRLGKDPMTNVAMQENDMYERSNKFSSIGGNGTSGGGEFGRHEVAASNASLLVEAALDSVCQQEHSDGGGGAAHSQPDTQTQPPPIPLETHCNTDTLVGNLYGLAHHLADVPYGVAVGDGGGLGMSPPRPHGNEHISVTDELSDKLHRHTTADTIGMHYGEFHQHDFSPPPGPQPPHSPDMNRSNFVRNYINSLSPQNMTYHQPHHQHSQQKSISPEPATSRYADHFSSDDSNGMAVQNLSLHPSKSEMQLDLSIYKTYKASQDYMKKLTFEHKTDDLEQDQIEVDQPIVTSDSEKKSDNQEHCKYSEDLTADIRTKFDIDLEMRLKSYEAMERNHLYESNEMEFRSKTSYDICDVMENRNKQYELESDFCRSERVPAAAFEPLMLNTSELQGLDMSARSGFHSYANIQRYHHLYPEMDRVDLRLNYGSTSPPPPLQSAPAVPPPPPPPPSYSHAAAAAAAAAADLLRVVSLDLSTPPGNPAAPPARPCTVDLSLRAHPAAALHQIAAVAASHRLLGTDLAAARHHLSLSDATAIASARLLTDHTTSRLLNESSANHLLTTASAADDTGNNGSGNSNGGRLLSEQSVRLLEQQNRLMITEAARNGGPTLATACNTSGGGLLQVQPTAPSASNNGVSTSPSPFGGFSAPAAIPQPPYHPTPLAPQPRTHITASTSPPSYHYPAYY
ncbi:unnamed protein product [Acanthoscelides obtectus]|uniref:Uncharacterized protein n=1 Tax=Acanthoscelides obtectus TaxID=200917 RepID=A0A9P0LZ71_ACAOB|nr:unnamed protein product [Acanthoscelides obtectus]CAK1636219.1 hypothetical protein AOBTE_LOCUS9783 [Acanthoscelides obtectus]